MSEESKETDRLVYEGNNIPPVIKIVWIALIIFCIVYLVKFMMPDLAEWWTRWTA